MSNLLKLLALLSLSGLAACNSAAVGTDGGYLSWSPPGLWISAPAGGQATGTVTLTNTGNEPGTVSSVAVTGATRPVFTVYYTAALVVDLDAGLDITVIYAPPSCLDGGNDLADVSFVTDASDAPNYSVPVVGICTRAVASPDAGEDAG